MLHHHFFDNLKPWDDTGRAPVMHISPELAFQMFKVCNGTNIYSIYHFLALVNHREGRECLIPCQTEAGHVYFRDHWLLEHFERCLNEENLSSLLRVPQLSQLRSEGTFHEWFRKPAEAIRPTMLEALAVFRLRGYEVKSEASIEDCYINRSTFEGFLRALRTPCIIHNLPRAMFYNDEFARALRHVRERDPGFYREWLRGDLRSKRSQLAPDDINSLVDEADCPDTLEDVNLPSYRRRFGLRAPHSTIIPQEGSNAYHTDEKGDFKMQPVPEYRISEA